MLYAAWEWIVHNPLIIGTSTVVFFTVKGLLWLIVPALILRRRVCEVGRRRS